jgi:hypothetical protein
LNSGDNSHGKAMRLIVVPVVAGSSPVRHPCCEGIVDDAPVRLWALILGTSGSISGTVYGTIVVLAALTAGAKPGEHDLWHLAAVVAVTVLVFWGAHVYSDGLGESLSLGRRLTVDELAEIAKRERAIVIAGVLPVAFIVLGALNVLKDRTAVWLAFGAGVATLAGEGVRYARLERMGTGATILAVAFNVTLGLIFAALKVFVAH